MAKVLLAHPMFLALSPEEQAAASPYFPLGLLYLAAYARDHGHRVAVFDATWAAGPQDFAAAVDHHDPDVVGLSALLPTRAMALDLATIAHERGVVVVLGGPDPTATPAPYLAHPAVDVVVHHEGEQTVVRLLDLVDAGALDLAHLRTEPGVAYRDHGRPVVNQPRPPIENLDELPLPARDLVDMERYLAHWERTSGYTSVTLATSRGCPYGCEWCRDAVHGASFRQRSPASVAAEMKVLKEAYRIDRLRLVDDVDGLDRDWLEQWADAASSADAVIPFEALNDLARQDIPLLDVRDSL